MDNETTAMAMSLSRLKRIIAVRYLLVFFFLAAVFFLSAGTLDYWQAWAYMAILLLPMGLALLHYLKKDPELLERRMRTREKERKQMVILMLSIPFFLALYLLPGLDRRYGWSGVPAWLVIIAEIIVLACYLLFVRVMHENRFLSRVVEVDPKQKVVSTGPYAVVRHPMYAAVIPLYVFSPLALGSFWALVPAAFLPVFIIARIFNEEKILRTELAAYRKYARRVKFRLIPKIW
jgi:protein-S-isoprenylcysteine O-methyltransferase Ste14